mmetsp:Transcript_28658/g.39582  ORF Transcript_28658/g.39582 Transcript_28658/m.39582 type:complete len:165 (+) Transcript_28658:557-1051(+)|eukprot:CAMPEP_0196593996 /NCGR_PEP_ID=MMETSP1081-20130531/77102_1 /TAXON_ID=36882 /ORGANISM="Pyramimonas amylifera, Strain CCMP720" /LENGTH=164 /DNA_ID=CAMNT_0041918137 /DNA_START=556 /DNA_END=1050 /DNA_ORIENTATION=+
MSSEFEFRSKSQKLAALGSRELHELMQSANHLLEEIFHHTNLIINKKHLESCDSTRSEPPMLMHLTENNIIALKTRYIRSKGKLRDILKNCEEYEASSLVDTHKENEDDVQERQLLLARLSHLKHEALHKNMVLKGLIDEMRELLGDIATWNIVKKDAGEPVIR